MQKPQKKQNRQKKQQTTVHLTRRQQISSSLIDQIYVQERNDNTDEQCKEAKEAWDALTDAQKDW